MLVTNNCLFLEMVFDYAYVLVAGEEVGVVVSSVVLEKLNCSFNAEGLFFMLHVCVCVCEAVSDAYVHINV